MGTMRHGLVGYGLGGRYFHAPYIMAADGLDLAGVVTTNPKRRAELAEDYPGVPAYDSLAALIDAGVDAVTITTPPETRRDLVLEAIARGVAVVADKPFAPSAAAAQQLVDAADTAGVPLSVFHNRRWDTDIRTLHALLDRGELGTPWRVESRFDLDMPDALEPGPDGGLLRDLGTHLVDQMLWLLGPVTQVDAAMEWLDLPEGRTDATFTVLMRHASGPTSTVSATKLNRHAERELRVYGSAGHYVSRMNDVQTAAIFAGHRPVAGDDAWGREAPERWGELSAAEGIMRVPSERGAYQDYYTQFAAAVRGEASVPVTGADGVQALAVLDAARTSAEERRAVDVMPRG